MTASALPQLARALLDRLEAQRSLRLPSFEEFCTSPEFCGFTKASRVQRALMRAADGLQPDLTPEELEKHFGARDFVNPCRPSVILIECGVRAAKSLIAACGETYNTLDADVSVARPGELLKAFVTAPLLRQTSATFGHVKGTMQAGPALARFVVEANKESMSVRRPDGVQVEISAVAAAANGSNLRSTWVTSAVISEAAFFDDDEGAVNLSQQLFALRGRMLPRGQIWAESSPTTDTDPFHKLATEYFGKPGDGVLVFRSDTFSMFDSTKARTDERAMRRIDPQQADREFWAIPTSAAGTEFFPEAAIRAAIKHDRTLQLPPNGAPHWGGTDLAFRKNSSALALARFDDGKTILAYHEELAPEAGEPLRPSKVCEAFARTALAYKCFSVRGDLHYAETAKEEFGKCTKRYPNGEIERVRYDEWTPTLDANTEAFTEFRRLMLEGLLELPNDPRLLAQLAKVKSRVLPGGKIQIVLPKIGHTHGDIVAAVVLACVQVQALTTGRRWIEAMRVQSGTAEEPEAKAQPIATSRRFIDAMRAFGRR